MPKIIVDVPETCKGCKWNKISGHDGYNCHLFGGYTRENCPCLPACIEAQKEYEEIKELAKIGKDVLDHAAGLEVSKNKIKDYLKKFIYDKPWKQGQPDDRSVCDRCTQKQYRYCLKYEEPLKMIDYKLVQLDKCKQQDQPDGKGN